MRILQVHHNSIFEVGGHELFIRTLCEKLIKRGWRVSVITPSHKSIATMYTTAKGLILINLPVYWIHNRVHIFKPPHLRKAIEAIKSVQIVHIHSPDDPFTFLIGILSKLMGKKVITTIFAYADDLKHHEKIKRFWLITVMLQTLAAFFSDKVHVASTYDLAKMHLFKDKLVIIPLGVSDRFFKEKINRVKVNTCPLILYLGRINKAKGVDVLLRAIGIIVNKKIHVRLNIVGPDNAYLKTLQNLVKELKIEGYVEFLREVTDVEKKISLIDRSDIIVIPSLSDVVEAYSLVASEAWARGKWVVASNVGALKYRVKDGVNGYLCKPGDPIDLADKILKSFENNGVLRPPPDIWSLDRTTDAFEKLYIKVLNSQ